MHIKTAEGSYYIRLTVETDSAQANGIDAHRVKISCLDESTFLPASNLAIIFRTTGNAGINGTNNGIYLATTDAYGTSSITIRNRTAEEVTVSAIVREDPNASESVFITFGDSLAKFKITDAYNINTTFLNAGEPNIAWPGAEFSIRTKGGSGRVRWEVSGSPAEVTVDSNPTGEGIVRIRNKPRQVCVITATDLETKETDEFRMNITEFVRTDLQKVTLNSALNSHRDALLTPGEYKKLFRQWGNMARYSVWKTDSDYWTNDYWLTGARVVELKNGTEHDVSTILYPKNYYAYRIGG